MTHTKRNNNHNNGYTRIYQTNIQQPNDYDQRRTYGRMGVHVQTPPEQKIKKRKYLVLQKCLTK